MSEVQAEAKAGKVVNTVAMDDGREVAFSGKRRLLKDVQISEDGFDIKARFDVVNGETRTFKIAANKPLFARLAAHGLLQKVGDEVAGLEDPEDMVLALDEILDRLGRGEWGVERSRGEGNAMAGLSVLAKALVEVSGKTPQAIKDFLASKTNAEKLALRDNPSLKPVVARIEAERKPRKPKEKTAIDTQSMLDGLNA